MEGFRGADREDRGRRGRDDPDTAGSGYAVGLVDDQRRGAHPNILWCADALAPVLPGVRLRDLCAGVAALGQFVDHDSHHRRGPAGHQSCAGHQRGRGGGSYHLGRLFRR